MVSIGFKAVAGPASIGFKAVAGPARFLYTRLDGTYYGIACVRPSVRTYVRP